VTTAIGYLDRLDKVLLRRLLLHAGEKGYQLVALVLGPKAWASAETMIATGEAEVVVTTSNAQFASRPFVEVAGAGRTVLRTPARATRLRRIADLVDSGLSDDVILRILRDAR